jgi:hypothetical protein
MALKKMAARISESMNQAEGKEPVGKAKGMRKFAARIAKQPMAAAPEEEAAPKGRLGRIMKTVAARAAGKPVAMEKGGMADKSGRAMKRKTADTKGRAMKKGK